MMVIGVLIRKSSADRLWGRKFSRQTRREAKESLLPMNHYLEDVGMPEEQEEAEGNM